MASGAHALPAPGMAPATLSSRGDDQFTRSPDSQTTIEVLPRFAASSQEVPEAIRRSVAMIQYRSPAGERTTTGSRTPRVPTVETRTGEPLFRSVQCRPSSLWAR
ncbi:hypothetical protein GCM10009546_70210 [Actinomadura livida]|uniref:Uncharacterized protein n=1 Tax=Actinomadura livida TaxID=79909 RepID=A0A7W7MY32_9ACTN|nr:MULTISPECIES: hypothetical protein [Actinomadura]MBB4774427.1 hypothetical protein [Actinomadura catellatispora]GGT82592.1 hypothetical protein GCM10010208_01180 [Actinomadura livida]